MRTRHLILGLCGLVALGGLGWLIHLIADPSSAREDVAVGPELPVPEAEPEPLELPVGSADSPVREPRTDRTRPEVDERGDLHGAVIRHDQSASGFAVTGVIRFSDDGAPAAGLTFIIYNPGADLFLETDGQGRFTSEPMLQSGVTSFEHRVADEPGLYQSPLRFAPASLTLDGEVGETKEVELTLLQPELELDVLVVHRDDRLAPGALVELQYRYEAHPGEFHGNTEVAFSKADGIASFSLYDLEQINAGNTAGMVAFLEVKDQHGQEQILTSALLRLEFPLLSGGPAEPLRLVLDESGSILIRVKDSEGAPVPGQWTFVLGDDPHLYFLNRRTAESDERGEILVRGLPPRTYRVRPLVSSPGATEPEVVVHPGEISEVELVLPATRKQLAVSGRVVDEAGDPLAGVRIHVVYGYRDGPGDTSATTATDSAGRFEFHAPPCDGLTVHSNRNLHGDDFEPGTLELPFGATDIQFRRVRRVELKEIFLEVVDSASGERLDGVLLMTYRAPNLEDYSFQRTKEGLTSPYVADHPGTTIVFEHHGYRRKSATLAELEKFVPVDGPRRVLLERGLLRTLHVEGNDENGESAPVAGAAVRLEGRLLGRTDEAGELTVDLHTWPEQGLTVEAEAFAPATWAPRDGFADIEPAWVWLERK